MDYYLNGWHGYCFIIWLDNVSLRFLHWKTGCSEWNGRTLPQYHDRIMDI